MTADIFKNFASAMDRHIEIRRLVAEHHQRVEKYKTENAEALAKGLRPHCIRPYPKTDDIDWDYEPSGHQGVSNGEIGS
jgi:hypothetical protein